MNPGGERSWRRHTIQETSELRRIREMPRRSWTDADLASLAEEMTAALRTPTGTQKLRPVQALALHDIGTAGGLFGPIRVGGGKTLISLLAPYILDSRAPMLILPASLVSKAHREIVDLSRDWRIPRNIRIISYEMLGRVQAADTFKGYPPDLIVADEAHRLKNKKAGVTRRVVRFMREHPECHFVGISGTIMSRSIRDFAHIIRWTLPKGAPVPMSEGETEEWGDALDEKINPLKRSNPGALLTLCNANDEGEDELQTARRGFQRRLLDTEGVVATNGESVSCSLYLQAIRYEPSAATETNFETLRSRWETPDGWALSEAVAVWRHARELALGLHYIWSPRPPDEWLNARRSWAKFVRETLKYSRSLDTELQVANACRSGALDRQELDAWTAVRPSFTPASRALWHDDTALQVCQRWLAEKKGIVWCEHTYFAEELSNRTGLPYYGAGGLTRRGQDIKDATGPIIASIAANSTGRNLQAWNTNLITSCPSTATILEQLIGRTHRDGQTSDQVEVDILLGCWEHWDGFEKARSAARMAQDMLGQPQKLLIGDVEWPEEIEIARLPGARWHKSVDLKVSAEDMAISD